MRLVLTAVLTDRLFVALALVGLVAELVTLYLWLMRFALDPVIAWTAVAIWLFNLLLAFFGYLKLRAYSYLLLATPLLILVIAYAILVSLR